MNCQSVRTALDASFDDGRPLDVCFKAHLEGCTACCAYQDELMSLDGLLRAVPPVEADPALVARINAAVSQEPTRYALPHWAGLAVACAIVLVSLGGGWLVERYADVPELSMAALRPAAPLAPDWSTLRSDFAQLPSSAATELGAAVETLTGAWGAADQWLYRLLDGNSLAVWGACLAGLVLVVLVDGRELRRAR